MKTTAFPKVGVASQKQITRKKSDGNVNQWIWMQMILSDHFKEWHSNMLPVPISTSKRHNRMKSKIEIVSAFPLT